MLDNNTDHLKLWTDWLNYYLLVALHNNFNRYPKYLHLHELNEHDFNEWLKKFELDKTYDNYKFEIPDPNEVLKIPSISLMSVCYHYH